MISGASPAPLSTRQVLASGGEFDLPYTVIGETIWEFDFRCPIEGEIHAIVVHEYRYNVHQGDELYMEVSDPDGLGDQTEDPALAHRYLYGPAVDQVLAVEDGVGDVLWGLGDHQGTVRDVVDSSAALADHRKYDSFGRITQQSDDTVDYIFAYTGRPLDADTDLYDYRARWYDLQVGCFASEDPIGLAAGDANFYRYVGNSPVMNIDGPEGTTGLRGERGHH